MPEVVETDIFKHWMMRLKDSVARTLILTRLRRAAGGSLGDWKSVGGGVAEMRIDHGPGYRVYFIRRGERLIVILAAGTKRTQYADIIRAKEIVRELEA